MRWLLLRWFLWLFCSHAVPELRNLAGERWLVSEFDPEVIHFERQPSFSSFPRSDP